MATKKELEKRSYLCEVRAETTYAGNVITGRPIVFGERTDLGYFDEIIEPGALNGTDLTDVRFLVNHDTSKIPLARSRKNNGNSTMQLVVDSQGLQIFATLDTENNADARALWSAVNRGDITGMSFMFSINGRSWENEESDHPTRRITSIGSVVEVSACTFPAYPTTSINARSENDALESARLELESLRERRAKEVETSDELALLKAKISLF